MPLLANCTLKLTKLDGTTILEGRTPGDSRIQIQISNSSLLEVAKLQALLEDALSLMKKTTIGSVPTTVNKSQDSPSTSQS